ncbi:MAG: zinc-ribbon domain-containing protein [Dehalococcoidia bacterium]|nr:zinc-ribbon domain-containing protein [Dehalococcoidia bacterium]
MKAFNLKQSRWAAGLFRICICSLIALTAAAGGMVLDTEPVQAINIHADPAAVITVAECEPFSIQFSATGTACVPPPEPFFWFWPALPPYATLDANTGLLTGCPQVGDVSATFFVGVSEFSPPFCGPFTDNVMVTINVVPGAAACDMVIDPIPYPVAWEGLPYTMTLSVTGGVGPFLWSATGLPVGLSVTDNATGVISGTPGPLSCGIYTVTATVEDLGTCCCSPVSRPFILLVDCWANYPAIFYFTSACDFEVGVGPGLTYGQTSVTIDGEAHGMLPGGGSELYTSIPCESHLVMVDQTVPGPATNTRFAVQGPYYQQVTDTNNYAYFDYAQEAFIDTASQPAGITHPPGAGYYAIGGEFCSTAASPVMPPVEEGVKYLFRSWSLPGGSSDPNRDLSFTVSGAGTATAVYDTYYLLTLKSDEPSVNETSWWLKDSTATYKLSLQLVPLPNILGALGAVNRPLNANGEHVMTAPYTQQINWAQDYTIPILIIVAAVLIIAGLAALLIVLLLRKSAGPVPAAAGAAAPTTQPAAKASDGETETAVAKEDTGDRPNFCPKCGAPVEQDADFCKKCGRKLA